MNTIQSFWESYLKHVIPKDASETQIKETKRAFYAGAASMFRINIDMADNNLRLEAGAAIIQTVSEELEGFAMHEMMMKIKEAGEVSHETDTTNS